MRPDVWLQAAGYATWSVSGLPMLLAMARGRVGVPVALAWGCAYLGFGLAYHGACRRHDRAPAWPRRALLALQTITALVMVHLTSDGLAAATLVVVAAQLLYVAPPRWAVAWLVAQTVLLIASFWTKEGAVPAFVLGGAFAGFETFALATAALAHRERLARQELAQAHAELIATRSLLAEDSRVAERLRISRDLHDTIGHHLTALSLQLEVASRLSSGPAATHVEQAHAVTRLLLSDVRDVVSQLRDGRVDLAEAMRTLAAGVASLEVHLELPDPFELDDPAQAHALLRCVQEIATNATRHAAARHLWIRITQGSDGITLHARDDGRGAADLKWGNGLSGMRERFAEYDGRVEFTPGAGRGFEIHGFMPRPHPAP
jgi:signal transduction histidine kinase